MPMLLCLYMYIPHRGIAPKVLFIQPSKTIEAGGIYFEDSLLLPTTAP